MNNASASMHLQTLNHTFPYQFTIPLHDGINKEKPNMMEFQRGHPEPH